VRLLRETATLNKIMIPVNNAMTMTFPCLDRAVRLIDINE